ncbi:hypothetical protein KGQ20_04260 [Catenulispora sp. NF23]|uniref:DUF6262 family protein n=1 Tax=Catenulispora pinistramenti TaxID=2705254 RepID=UPI001BAB9DBF|nr:DUF6262 family protein [Catenulispora pinistramenti]MBS2531977.1 hypothetical protein [Catenulispora pinistramenti]
MPPVDNSRYLKADAAARHLDCVARVMEAIEAAKRDGAPFTVSGIARQAGVSRTFLHDPAQRDLLDCIRQSTTGRTVTAPLVPSAQRISTRSHETVVTALKNANEKLREQNAQLRDELAHALGDLRDLRRTTPTMIQENRQ